MVLTKRQRRILDFIRSFRERRGYSPTLSEIARHFGLRSPATVHKHLANLEQKGAVKRRSNSSRGIELRPEEGTTCSYELPLLGHLELGRPLVLQPPEEVVPVPPGLRGERDSFVLRVRGDGYRGELIGDGDLLVVEEAETMAEGGLSLCLLDGGRPALRRVEPGETVAPARLRGRVIGVLRKY
jgi:repressor LexA